MCDAGVRGLDGRGSRYYKRRRVDLVKWWQVQSVSKRYYDVGKVIPVNASLGVSFLITTGCMNRALGTLLAANAKSISNVRLALREAMDDFNHHSVAHLVRVG